MLRVVSLDVCRLGAMLSWGVLLGMPAAAQPDHAEDADLTVPWCAQTTAAHKAVHAMWHVLDRGYALFDIRFPGKDWPGVGNEACRSIAPGTPDEELFEIMMTMARRLDDGHVTLDAPALERFDDGQLVAYPYGEQMENLIETLEAEYLDAPLTWAARDTICWGTIGDVGYLRIAALEGLTRRGTERDDVRKAGKVMQRVAESMGDARGIIVDIRANDGGYDAVSLEIARWFAGDRALAWSKQWREGPDHHDFSTPPERLFVEAGGARALDIPVVVLTSPATFSAGDTLALAMRVRAQVTLMGEPTSGHLSDMYTEELPNGWELSFSGELYRAADGGYYEKRGVPPDVLVPFDADLLEECRRDIMLEAALKCLRDGSVPDVSPVSVPADERVGR